MDGLGYEICNDLTSIAVTLVLVFAPFGCVALALTILSGMRFRLRNGSPQFTYFGRNQNGVVLGP